MIYGLPTEPALDRKNSYEVVQSAKLQATKYNNLIPYPGTPLWNELKDSDRLVVTKDWRNFNSVLSMTTSIFDKTPLPYVPETCSDWELRRDIVRYNIKSYVNLKSLAAIFGHTKGIGWFMLPEKWYYKPRELYEMFKIGVQLLTNMFMTWLPLNISEFIMNIINPDTKKRQRVNNYDPTSYKTVDWERVDIMRKRDLLRKAEEKLKVVT